MTRQEFDSLQRGDLVAPRFDTGKPTIVVDANYGGRVTAMLTFDMTNHQEWDLVGKVSYESSREDYCNCAGDFTDGLAYCQQCGLKART